MLIPAFAGMTIFTQLAFANGSEPAEPEATKVMNAHGETMELDFQLYEPGTETLVDYSKYGTLENVGTEKYAYKMTDRKGLAAAVGEGVYPNNSIFKDLRQSYLGGTEARPPVPISQLKSPKHREGR